MAKKCPFCGGVAFLRFSYGRPNKFGNKIKGYIECSVCGATIVREGNKTDDVRVEVVEAWTPRTGATCEP